MNAKRYVIASICAMIVITVVETIGHGYFMTGLYQMSSSLWRSQEAMESLLWLGYLSTVITSLIVVYIYHKGYEGKSSGLLEGLRFGIWIGLFVAIPMAAWSYVSMPIRIALAGGWFLIAFIKYVLAGIVIGLVYKK